MEKPLGTVSVGLQFGWGRFSGNHQRGENSVCQADGDSEADVAPACRLCGWRDQKEQWRLPALLSGKKLCPLPSALTLMPDNSVPPYMSLVPFRLLLRGSESE